MYTYTDYTPSKLREDRLVMVTVITVYTFIDWKSYISEVWINDICILLPTINEYLLE